LGWRFGLSAWVRVSPFFVCLPLIGGSIEGRVTDSVAGGGIGGVSVTLGPAVTMPNQIRILAPGAGLVTEESGAFRVDNIPDGEYLPMLNKSGYMGTLLPVVWNTVRVSGQTRLDLQMTRLASLRGRVVDQDKMPVAGITVQARRGS
jgi:hypothetical protein